VQTPNQTYGFTTDGKAPSASNPLSFNGSNVLGSVNLASTTHQFSTYLSDSWQASERLSLEVLELQVYPDDVFLLCSDGLYQEITRNALCRALSLAAPQVALQRLFDEALDGAARDNLTAVVVRQ